MWNIHVCRFVLNLFWLNCIFSSRRSTCLYLSICICIWVNIGMFFLSISRCSTCPYLSICICLWILFFLSLSRCSTCPLEARSAWNAGYRFSNSNTQIQTQIKMSHIYYNHKVKVEEMQSWKQQQNLMEWNATSTHTSTTKTHTQNINTPANKPNRKKHKQNIA